MTKLIHAELTFGLKGFKVLVYPSSYTISEPYEDKANPPNAIVISRQAADAIREVQEVLSKYRGSYG